MSAMNSQVSKGDALDSLTLTYSTRLRIDAEADRRYLDGRFEFYSNIEHSLYNGLAHGRLEPKGLRGRVAHKYGISGRQANSLVHKASGRLRSLKALKSLEKTALEQRINAIQNKLEAIASEIAVLKLEAAENIITMKNLDKLRKLKAKKHRLSQKLNQLKQKLAGFEKRANSLCFGGKRPFKAQHNLEENGFSSHTEWQRKWRKARANSWYFLGAASESFGNQNCQYDIGKEEARIRADTIKLNHIVIGDVRFSYGAEAIRAAQQSKQPVTSRVCKTGRKYYIRISVNIPKPQEVTNKINGGIGLDYNKGFIQECEVNRDGNIIGFNRYMLPDSGKDKAKGEAALRAAVKDIAEITIEKLDFKKKKAAVNKHVSKNKKHNAMINSFDYARYTEYLETACYKAGVYLCKINPYNTSKTGAAKYAKQKGLNAHQAASYAIGRKGLGFKM